nr:retrovirus-related Pol polyprotein from transposon TNT 1-94 [Tanacetum cinerariifolium]GEZ99768.1 retrovirus-related Pol polyprotein from transposon TNT 1-94 [Tanacetum cinerariifolium]
MAAVNDVPHLVDKKGGSYAAIAPKLQPGKFNKWKKQMLCYLAEMEPYYLKYIKDGPFQPKTVDCDAKLDLLEKCLTFSQGLRNANHTQTLDLADIYERFVYEDNLIQRRSSEEYLRDLDVEYQERALLANSKRFIKRRTTSQDEEEVSDDEEVTQVKVLMALADDELTVGKIHARNGEWVEITIRKVNIILSMDEDADCQNYLKYINIYLKFAEE